MSKRHYWQGSHDNFCGFYAAADIIARHKTKNSGDASKHEQFFHKALLGLMKSAESLRWLTAHRIAARVKSGGFTSPEIAQVFNNLSRSAREELIATPFASEQFQRFAEKTEPKTRVTFPNCAIVKHDRGNHWLTVFGVRTDGSYRCFDPSVVNVRRRERIQWDDGVLIAFPGAINT